MTQTLPLLPLTNGVVTPGMRVTIALETPEAAAAVEAASGRILLVPKIDGRYARVGAIAQIVERGPSAVVVQGLERASIGSGVPGTGSALWVECEPAIETGVTDDARDLAREYRAVLDNILEARGLQRLSAMLHEIDEPGAMADVAVWSPDLSTERKVQVLETLDVTDRLRLVLGWARDTLADLTLKDKIGRDVREGMDRQQREYILRQQLRAIQRELGESSEQTADYREQLDALPEKVREAVERELDRLERTSEANPEQGWIRTWIETVLALPWGKRTDDTLDVDQAKQQLDADHQGLDDVKDRILEYLAARKLRAERGMGTAGRGAIIALTGPPGVGKTSLGESVAKALGRSFVRVSLGGIRDEAEIRGHRRTYVGAMPGRIARALKEAGTMNPVLLLDEVDKVGGDWRGDPSAALLEVLDPAQNHTFRDHYLEVDLDLSEVLFIATANVVETIPGPLLDRLDVVRLDGYTSDEKVAIARHHLLARQLERAGLRPDEVDIPDEILRELAEDFTREAGVRQLEREIGRLLRKVAVKVASGQTHVVIDSIKPWLGRPRFFAEVAERTSVPGVATGLAVTGTGGDVLFIEATAMDGPSGLKITGQLGDVMRESAEIALSYVRSHADELGVTVGERAFHLHVPAGAVPKDGPSAGVTMTTALVSLLSGRPVLPTLGMTGEVTLRGKVLPIGGVKQKVLAAHRAGLTQVVLPRRNEADLEDVPSQVLEAITVHLVEDVRDVIELALASSNHDRKDSAA